MAPPLPNGPNGRRGQRSTGRAPQSTRKKEDSLISLELEEIRLREIELLRLEKEMKRKVDELPRKIQEQQRKREEMIRIRAVSTATMADGILADKRHRTARGSSGPRRVTRSEDRSARLQLMVLCVILAGFVVLLLRSLPH